TIEVSADADVDVGVHVEEAKLNALEDNRIEGLGLDTVPFLLFTGSSHAGARIDHLVAAFNDLRARGHDLAAVLVGDDLGTIDEMVDRTRSEERRVGKECRARGWSEHYEKIALTID